jgi:Actin
VPHAALQLGWEVGEEGNLLIAEPLCTPRVSSRGETPALHQSSPRVTRDNQAHRDVISMCCVLPEMHPASSRAAAAIEAMRLLGRTSQDDREQLAQLAFEVFNVSGLFFADQALLSLYAVGKSTGLVIDFGHTKTGRQNG